MCFLHRLIAALRFFWDGHKAKAPATLNSEGEAWKRCFETFLWSGQGLPLGSALQDAGNAAFLMGA